MHTGVGVGDEKRGRGLKITKVGVVGGWVYIPHEGRNVANENSRQGGYLSRS